MNKLIFLIILSITPLFSQVKIEVLDTTNFNKSVHFDLDAMGDFVVLVGDKSGTNCPYITTTKNLKNWKDTYITCDSDTIDYNRWGRMFSIVILNNNVLAAGDSVKLFTSNNKANEWSITKTEQKLTNWTAQVTRSFDRKFALYTERYSARIFDDNLNQWTEIATSFSLNVNSILNGAIYDKDNFVLGVLYDSIITYPVINQSILVYHNGEVNRTDFPDRRLNNYYFLNNKIFAIGTLKSLKDSSDLKHFLMVSDDFGKTWYEHPVTNQFNKNAFISKIRFYDEKIGIFIGSQAEWYLTEDGGETWKKQENYLQTNKFNYANAYFAFLSRNKIICTAGNFPIIFTIEFPLTNIEEDTKAITDISQSNHIELYDILGKSIATFPSYEKLKAEIENYPPPHLIKWRDEKGIFHFEKMK